MTIFEIYGGNAPNSVAAYGNGITLGILGKSQSLGLTFDRKLSIYAFSIVRCNPADVKEVLSFVGSGCFSDLPFQLCKCGSAACPVLPL